MIGVLFVVTILVVTDLRNGLFGEFISTDGMMNIGVSDGGKFDVNGDDPPPNFVPSVHDQAGDHQVATGRSIQLYVHVTIASSGRMLSSYVYSVQVSARGENIHVNITTHAVA